MGGGGVMLNVLVLMQVFLPQILFYVSREIRRRREQARQPENVIPAANEVREAGSNTVVAEHPGIRPARVERPLRLAA
jgi:hypothetical protein